MVVITGTAIALGLGAAATAYSGYAAAQAARKQAEAMRAQTAEARDKANKELAQMQSDAAATQKRFGLQIQQSRDATAESARQAEQSTKMAQARMEQAQAASNLSIHQQQLSAAQARQLQAGANVKNKRRVKRGTPEAMRTKLSIDSGLGGTPGETAAVSGMGGNYG